MGNYLATKQVAKGGASKVGLVRIGDWDCVNSPDIPTIMTSALSPLAARDLTSSKLQILFSGVVASCE